MSYDAWKLQAPPDEPEDMSEMCDECRHCVDGEGEPWCIADYNLRHIYSITRIRPYYEPCADFEEALMDHHEPITTELRGLIAGSIHTRRLSPPYDPCVELDEDAALRMCDSIDAVHANLERYNADLRRERDSITSSAYAGGYEAGYAENEEENAALFSEVQRLEHERKTISTVYVDVKPRIDWEQMAREFERFASVVRGMDGDTDADSTTTSVLREFAGKLCDLCATEYSCDETRAELLGQYAVKLDALCAT